MSRPAWVSRYVAAGDNSVQLVEDTARRRGTLYRAVAAARESALAPKLDVAASGWHGTPERAWATLKTRIPSWAFAGAKGAVG